MCGCAELSTKVSALARADMVGQIIANMLKMVVSAYYFGTERRLGFGIKSLFSGQAVYIFCGGKVIVIIR